MDYKGIIKINTFLFPEGTPVNDNIMTDIQKLGHESIKGLETKAYRLNERQ